MPCELCETSAGSVLWQDRQVRVVHVADPDYSGYCRVIWNAHVAEMSDLDAAERAHCMRVVFALESVLRELLAPAKINLASLGNMTPHVHWHVIARFRDDAHFPQSVWSARQRETAAPRKAPAQLLQQLSQALATRLMA
jgi:diadenosine tetraphosphate (Ap4A) HIT family hydrolase